MPLRRGFGGVSSGAGGNLFDRPGFFDIAEIDNLTVENPKFFLEIIKKPSTELSPNKKQEIYEDNIGAVKKIIKSEPRKIWPKKKRILIFWF